MQASATRDPAGDPAGGAAAAGPAPSRARAAGLAGVRRTILQALVFVAAAFVAGYTSNALRPTLEWGGNDPLLLKHGIDGLTVDEAALYQEDPTVLYLDVRPVAASERERIRGAIGFAAGDFAVTYDEMRDFLGPGVKLIVYGDDMLPAVRAAEFLIARGHTAWVLEGGWRAWKKAQLPTEGTPGP